MSEKVCEREGCEVRFKPRNSCAKYCCRTCKRAAEYQVQRRARMQEYLDGRPKRSRGNKAWGKLRWGKQLYGGAVSEDLSVPKSP